MTARSLWRSIIRNNRWADPQCYCGHAELAHMRSWHDSDCVLCRCKRFKRVRGQHRPRQLLPELCEICGAVPADHGSDGAHPRCWNCGQYREAHTGPKSRCYSKT
jgi:hypothetical protein